MKYQTGKCIFYLNIILNNLFTKSDTKTVEAGIFFYTYIGSLLHFYKINYLWYLAFLFLLSEYEVSL